MSTAKTRRAGAIITSIAAVGLIIGGVAGVSAAFAAQSVPAPAPTSTYEPAAPMTPSPDAVERAAAREAERVAAEAEAARIEAERVAAEAAVAQAEADRIAAEQAAADQAARESAPAAPVAPAAPAPAPQPGGDQQAGECREYNDANECTAWYVP